MIRADGSGRLIIRQGDQLRDTVCTHGHSAGRALRVIGALSYALDLTEGEPPGHAVRSCQIGMRLAQELGLDAGDPLAPVLRAAAQGRRAARRTRRGWRRCSAPTTTSPSAPSKRVDWSGALPAFVWSLRTVAPGGSLARARSDRLLAIKAEGEVTRALMQARCDRGAEIALHARASSRDAPRRSARSTSTGTAAASRAGCAARRSRCSGGSSASPRRPRSSTPTGGVARRVATSPDGAAGGWFDPALVDALGRAPRRHGVLGVAARRRRRRLGAGGPAADRRRRAAGPDRRRRSPAWSTRSRRGPTATPTARALIALGLASRARRRRRGRLRDLRRAALLHDVGKLAISNRILDKPGAADRRRVRAGQASTR